LKREPGKRELDSGMLIFGIFMGLFIGGAVTLFKAPKSGVALRRQIADSVSDTGQNLRSSLEAVVPTDPVAESMAQGKAAARRRLVELGQG
jgi:gas vesicle protein